ncbi:MAG: YciI family protein [Anaerolineales bacterium]
MRYMLLVYLDESWDSRPLAERQRVYLDQVQANEELEARGQYLAGSPLHPPSSATTVRVRSGKPLLTDGPFAETREHLGGYMLIDVENLDAAIAHAARAPLARVGCIEVRPVREGPPAE